MPEMALIRPTGDHAIRAGGQTIAGVQPQPQTINWHRRLAVGGDSNSCLGDCSIIVGRLHGQRLQARLGQAPINLVRRFAPLGQALVSRQKLYLSHVTVAVRYRHAHLHCRPHAHAFACAG